MRIHKKIFTGILSVILIMHSLFIPLALPGFVFCLRTDGHFAIEPETSVQHEHRDGSYKTNIHTIITGEDYLDHSENCFDISLDRDNDYQHKNTQISPKFVWKLQNLFTPNPAEKNESFLQNHFFISLNTSTTHLIISLETTHLLI